MFERTATGFATWSLESDPEDPLRLTVYIRRLDEAENPKPLSTTLHFFGGAAEAAGGYMRELPSAARDSPRLWANSSISSAQRALSWRESSLCRAIWSTSAPLVWTPSSRPARVSTSRLPSLAGETFSHLCGAVRVVK